MNRQWVKPPCNACLFSLVTPATVNRLEENVLVQQFHLVCRSFSCRWYRLDENSIPAAYVLQPVSTWIPELFNEENETVKKAAQEEWARQFTRLKDSLVKAAKAVRESKEYHKYVQSGESTRC